MIKKEKTKEHEATKRDSFKYKKRLFTELPETLQGFLKQLKETSCKGLQVDLAELDSGTSSRWRQITRLFEDLNKYDHKTISTYLEDNPTNNEAKCNSAINYFSEFIKRTEKPKKSVVPSNSSGAKEELKRAQVKDDWMKIYIISYQYISNKFVELAIPCTAQVFSTDNTKTLLEAIKQIQTLNEFLLLISLAKQSQITLLQYETTLVLFLGDKIGEIQEKLTNMAFSVNPNTIAEVLYYHYETLAMLTSYNAGKKFMKDAADDGIKYAFGIFEQSLRNSLSSSLFKEIFSSLIEGAEKWINVPNDPHLFFSAKYGKKKFQYFHYPSSSSGDVIKFSLGYITLYYAHKIALIMIDRDMFRQEERTMVTLAAFLKKNINILSEMCFVKDNLKVLSLKQQVKVESLLNENCIFLKFIKRILTIVDNPLGLIEKLSLPSILKNFLSTHIVVSVKNPFINTQPTEDYSIYSQDLLANVFRTLYKLKKLRVLASSNNAIITSAKLIKKSHVHLMILVDEVVLEAAASALTYLDNINGKLGKLRELLVEYFSDEKFAVTEKYRDFLSKLYFGPIFNYTAPETLEPNKLQELSLNTINTKAMKTLLMALAKAVRQDKKIIRSSFQKLIQLIKTSKDDLVSFGLLKLIYCILTEEAYDDWTFHQILQQKEVPNIGSSFMQEFIDSDGLRSLLKALIASYIVEQIDHVQILEQGILLLLSISLMCKALIGGQEEIRELLDLAMNNSRCNSFALEVTKIYLKFLKEQTELPTVTYFPDLIIRAIHKTLIERIEDERTNNLCFPFYDALNEFLECNTKSLVSYQNDIFHRKAWLSLISLLAIHKYIYNKV